MPDAPGVGSTRINVSVQFSPDVRGIEADNGILLRDGSQEPMWMVLSSLATAVLALALSGYVLWRSRRRPPLYSPPSIP
ncbi:MAG: hypothetical protein JWN15_2952 [Firmicutes bacterium]|nr:hypothetical protein [Bacillota bacterium]